MAVKASDIAFLKGWPSRRPLELASEAFTPSIGLSSAGPRGQGLLAFLFTGISGPEVVRAWAVGPGATPRVPLAIALRGHWDL